MDAHCALTITDSCSEFNYRRNEEGVCVLEPGREPIPDDNSCRNDEDYWYERTPYRKIRHSSCEGGTRLDRGAPHACPGLKSHGAFFWLFMLMIPCAFAGLIGWWYYRKYGHGAGYVGDAALLNNALTFDITAIYDYQVAISTTAVARAPSTHSRPYRGTSWASPVLYGRQSRHDSAGSPRVCTRAADIGLYQ